MPGRRCQITEPLRSSSETIARNGLSLERRSATADPAVPTARTRERSAEIFTTAEIRLTADMQALFGAVHRQHGRRVGREFQRAGLDEIRPWRSIARFIMRAARANVDDRPLLDQQILAITDRLSEFAREVLRNRRYRRAA